MRGYLIGIGVTVLVVAGASYLYVSSRQSVVAPVLDTSNGEMMTDAVDDAMDDARDEIMPHTDGAELLEYSKKEYEAAVASNKLVVLYFYANWCPDCRAEFPITQQVFQSLASPDVVGFRVHYNDDQTGADEKDLARQFGVAYQHTKVFIKNGQRVLKSPETWDAARYNQEISNALN